VSGLAEDEQEQRASETPSVDELIEQIRAVKVGEFLVATASTLASLAYGKLDAGELDDARVGIDALRALLPVLQGQIPDEQRRDLEQAVANLQLAYASAAGKASQ
jgi:hypothetical protein